MSCSLTEIFLQFNWKKIFLVSLEISFNIMKGFHNVISFIHFFCLVYELVCFSFLLKVAENVRAGNENNGTEKQRNVVSKGVKSVFEIYIAL